MNIVHEIRRVICSIIRRPTWVSVFSLAYVGIGILSFLYCTGVKKEATLDMGQGAGSPVP